MSPPVDTGSGASVLVTLSTALVATEVASVSALLSPLVSAVAELTVARFDRLEPLGAEAGTFTTRVKVWVPAEAASLWMVQRRLPPWPTSGLVQLQAAG